MTASLTVMPSTEPRGFADADAEITRLALAARAGDRAAATAFVEATQHHVRRFVAHLVGPAEAEDVAQEVYLRAMRALPSFVARSSARTWLLAIARRACADHVRTAMRRPRLIAVADWQATADEEQTRDQTDGFASTHALVDLIRSLPTDRREAFVATQVVGLSYAEAAEVCGCPVGTIRSRVARAREDLVTAMTDTGRRPSAAAPDELIPGTSPLLRRQVGEDVPDESRTSCLPTDRPRSAWPPPSLPPEPRFCRPLRPGRTTNCLPAPRPTAPRWPTRRARSR